MKMVNLWNDIYDHKKKYNIAYVELLELSLKVIKQEILKVKDIDTLKDEDIDDLLDFYDNVEDLLEELYDKVENKHFNDDETGVDEKEIANELSNSYKEFIELPDEVPDTNQEWDEYYKKMYDILDDFYTNIQEIL